MIAMSRNPLISIKLGLFAVLIVALGVPTLAGGVLARDWARETLTDAFMEKAFLLEHQVKSNIEYALELGIPLENERMIDSTFEYLSRLLEDHREVRFIAVADNTLKLIVYEGANKERLKGILGAPAVTASLERSGRAEGLRRQVHVEGFTIAISPLATENNDFGWIFVAADSGRTDAYLASGLVPFLAIVLCIVIVLWQAAAFSVDYLLADRFHQIHHAFTATSETYTGTLDEVRRYDDPGYIIQLHNAIVRRLQDRYCQFRIYESEIHQAVYDRSVAEKVKLVSIDAERELGHLREPGGVSLGLSAETRLRLPLLLLSFGTGLLVLVPLDGGWAPARFDKTSITALFAALFAVLPAFAWVLSRYAPKGSPKPLLVLASVMLPAAAMAWGGGLSGALAPVLASSSALAVLSFCSFAAAAHLRFSTAPGWRSLAWLLSVIISGAAAALCLDLGLGDLFGAAARIVMIILVGGVALVLALFVAGETAAEITPAEKERG